MNTSQKAVSKIVKAKAYTNGEVALISWELASMIHGCLGFEVTRMYPDDPSQNTVLAAWVAFKGQSNPDWKPQNTSVWPIQKLSWRDVTLIKRRDQLQLRPENTNIQYCIRPVVAYDENLEEVHTTLPVTYTGTPVKLSYLDKGIGTNILSIGTQFGSIQSTFTNGILATQWLSRTLIGKGNNSLTILKQEIQKQNSEIRTYLTGNVLPAILGLLHKANASGATLRMAIYELSDTELIDAITALKGKVEIILSNTSKDEHGNWDGENSAARQKLKKAGVIVHDRYFNNAHIGHNKFVIYIENKKPVSVLMGSTNWTPTGLCTQSNNTSVIESDQVAMLYNTYWENLRDDTKLFVTPNPLSAGSKNVQGSAFRAANLAGNKPVILKDQTKITVWFSPNTLKKNVDKTQIPPDLSAIYSLMRKAGKAIFFAVFLPGRSNDLSGDIMTNIISEAISIGQKDNSILVYGAISDPTAMPNYVAPPRKGSTDTDDDNTDVPAEKVPTPTTYDKDNVHLVRAYNLRKDDLIGNFEAELYSAGHAIIHDKIIVIDPFSDHAIAVFGSHNMGFKASYSNDENLIIVENNPALVQAYAVHVLDIYEHYRFRAIQAELHDENKPEWDGFLSLSDGWLEKAMSANGKGDLADYMCG